MVKGGIRLGEICSSEELHNRLEFYCGCLDECGISYNKDEIENLLKS